MKNWTQIVPNPFSDLTPTCKSTTDSPSDLKYYIVIETLNPRLCNAGDSGLRHTIQKGVLDLIDGNQDLC